MEPIINLEPSSSFFGEIKRQVQLGLSGFYDGIPIPGMPDITEYLGGLQKARYDLIGGNTGTGKTAFVDWCYVVAPIWYLYQRAVRGEELEYNFRVIYFSMEISKSIKLSKLACLWLYMAHGLIIDYKELLSFNRKRLSPEKQQLIEQAEPFFKFLQDRVDIIEGARKPTSIKIHVDNYAQTHGKIRWVNIHTGEELSKFPTDRPDRDDYRRTYIPKDPKEFVEVVSDHIGLLRLEKDMNKKQTIDEHSAYCVGYRNLYKYAVVQVSQFNRELADIGRKQFSELTPQIEDFKDSGNTQEDADTVIALFDPRRYNIKMYKLYDVAQMQGRLRLVFFLKNRNGLDNVSKGLRFIGENGHFCELPNGDVMRDDRSLYGVANDLRNKTVESNQ